jgi:hypothetical protein
MSFSSLLTCLPVKYLKYPKSLRLKNILKVLHAAKIIIFDTYKFCKWEKLMMNKAPSKIVVWQILVPHWCVSLYFLEIYIALRVPLVTAYPSRAPEFNPGFQWGLCYSIFSFMCMFCFVDRCLSFCTFFFWPLCSLFFFDIRILVLSEKSQSHFIVYFFSVIFV